MIDRKVTGQADRPVRTRGFTWPEVLRAVAHVLSRPDGPRHQAEVEPYGTTGIDAGLVVYPHRECRPLFLADVRAWLTVMDTVVSIRMSRVSAQVWFYVVGVISGGPTVEVRMPLRPDDVPVEIGFRSRQVTVDDLVAMAEQDHTGGDHTGGDVAAGGQVLAGAR